MTEQTMPPLIDPNDSCQDFRCSRVNGKCVGMHCSRCGGSCGSQGHYTTICRNRPLREQPTTKHHFCCPDGTCELDQLA